MPYGENKTKSLGFGEELTNGPSPKKLKSTKEAYVVSHDGSADFQGFPEKRWTDWIPLSNVGDKEKGKTQKNTNDTTDILQNLSVLSSGNQPVVTKSNDSEVSKVMNSPVVSGDNNKASRQNNFDEIWIKEQTSKASIITRKEEVEEYSTSKAFIGPIYKTPDENKCDERKNSIRHNREANRKKNPSPCGRPENKQKSKSEIDDELCQFYKEIQQLESDKEDSDGNNQDLETSQEQPIPYYDYNQNDSLMSDDQKKDFQCSDKQPFCGDKNYFNNDSSGWRMDYAFSGGIEPTVCNNSAPPFRPEWHPMQTFIVPQGPPPPSKFNCHLHFQRFSSTPCLPNTFQGQSDRLPQNYDGDHGNSGIMNWAYPLLDHSSKYPDHNGSSRSTLASRNGYGDQGGQVNNGFCETREERWSQAMYRTDDTDRFTCHQFPEEKLKRLQKLLILLRGLPGSGKTTLSRVLLGQSRDGIVFSTDDYFRQQDGYMYNVSLLGDAHDWNQNRAKQAIDQGRSPVIIDNTNTQAWEMKPYVEMAIGKGYRVEFHEPETWWKFDPEELEKRNKHGVPREKIAQMLDRYEFQMSISIVMNSVEPPHKSTQRPPPLQRRLREDLKKKTGHKLSKAKQRRNRRRNRKLKNDSKILEKRPDDTLSHLAPEDQDTSESEEEDSEEEGKVGDPGQTLIISENRCSWARDSSQKPDLEKETFPNVFSEISVALSGPPKSHSLGESSNLFLVNMTSSQSKKLYTHAFEQQIMDQNPNLVGNRTNSCTGNDRRSGMKAENCIEVSHTMVLDICDRFVSAKTTYVLKEESAIISENHKKKEALSNHCRSVSDSFKGEHKSSPNKTNSWAFFSTCSPDERMQLGSGSNALLGSWPEGPHKFVCEQRQRKGRQPKGACSDSTVGRIELVCHSKAAEGTSPQTLRENDCHLWEEDLSLPNTEKTHMIPVIETGGNVLRNHFALQTQTSVATEKKGRPRRIFNLAPNFHLPRLTAILIKERDKDTLLTNSRWLENIVETEKSSLPEVDHEKGNEQGPLVAYNQPPQYYHDPLEIASSRSGVKPHSHIILLRSPGCLSEKFLPPLLHCTSSLLKVSFIREKQLLPLKLQAVGGNKQKGRELTSEIFKSEPDILSSVRVTSEYPTHFNVFSGGLSEKLPKRNKPEPLQSLQMEDNQDSINPTPDSIALPLSLGFALQLVGLFGSPGVPIESLLPDDFTVPLDWKTLKMIHLQWKNSVEERQKKISQQSKKSLISDLSRLRAADKPDHQEEQEYSKRSLPKGDREDSFPVNTRADWVSMSNRS
ncbi:uncharacterized protein LOC100079951 isoform X1 [Ornithorhynchus anatinus]|uniref:NEDD4 binding protein 2 like 2 n=1 Tax=Ornithorhynchus anatinus TaxID=9258 RepID=F7B8U4_ORNAN|nr:uncharacterized protein LOC100079951 isoform X1 [Ornithorhynchus anatinus]XP_028903876.1 uncharacterized protein LOC100079951 isoform X1 [Ornithorhynchus anatinus]